MSKSNHVQVLAVLVAEVDKGLLEAECLLPSNSEQLWITVNIMGVGGDYVTRQP